MTGWKLNGLEVNAQLTRWFVSFAELSCDTMQACDRQTDRQNWRGIYAHSIYAVARKNRRKQFCRVPHGELMSDK